MDLDSLLRFTSLIHQFAHVERKILGTGMERNENDAEHSFQLALTAWYLNDHHTLGLDSDKLLKYALVHDFVEIYAGDTDAFTRDHTLRSSKQVREHAAAERLKKEHPEFPEMHGAITAYETREDRESKFIYTLDKLLPMMNTYLDDGRSWRRDAITLDMILDYKTEKMKLSPKIEAYFHALVKTVREKEAELFGKK